MMMLASTMPPISYLQVALASLALLLVMAISVWLKLGIVKSLLIASFRTVVQLSLIGLVLAWIFAREQWYEVLAILTFMSVVATIAAIQNGITPTINSMMVVGVVSLPGMMTGQILAGADPHQAVLYQIITLFLIATSSTLGCTIATLLIFRRFFNPEWQFVIPPTAKTSH